MAGVGFLQSLWEKAIWEGVWPHLDPMDTVCLLFMHSMHGMECAREVRAAWRVFFLLIQKEPATVPGSETFVVSSMLTSVLPLLC